MIVKWEDGTKIYNIGRITNQSVEVFFEDCLKFIHYEKFKHGNELVFVFDASEPGTTNWGNFVFKYSNEDTNVKFHDVFHSIFAHYMGLQNIAMKSKISLRCVRVNKITNCKVNVYQ